MALIITDETLTKAKTSAEELLIDLACYLYDKKRMSMGQARHLAGLDQIRFQKELASEIFTSTTPKTISRKTWIIWGFAYDCGKRYFVNFKPPPGRFD